MFLYIINIICQEVVDVKVAVDDDMGNYLLKKIDFLLTQAKDHNLNLGLH